MTLLFGIGPRRARSLLRCLPDIELLFTSSLRELQQLSGFPPHVLKKMNREYALSLASDILEFNLIHNIQMLSIDDADYPRRLRQCEDAPLVLYKKGDAELNASRMVAVVGTRSSTDYGEQLCDELVDSFRDQSITVVSGLAYGIDAQAHRHSCELGIPNIAVLGNGLDRIYPYQHRKLAAMILENGALVSEFVPGTAPDRENFPQRNRIVAGMCDAIVVVESKDSGGSLITASLGFNYNRDVFAYPGDVHKATFKGCNQLIQQDAARLITSGKDLLALMGWELSGKKPVQTQCFPDLTPIQQSIVEATSTEGTHIDVIAMRCEIPISRLQTELLALELDGLIRCVPGSRYKRT